MAAEALKDAEGRIPRRCENCASCNKEHGLDGGPYEARLLPCKRFSCEEDGMIFYTHSEDFCCWFVPREEDKPYALHHDGWGECPLCTDGAYSTMGGMLFDTAEEAIATLTQQNEWVSKSALIEWLRPYLHTGEPIPADVLISDIQMMPPTLTPQNEWISVEERLPEGHMQVLMWSSKWNIAEAGSYWNKHFWVYSEIGDGYIAENITHWMPLPKPPEGDEDI